mgnify:CR=1 FL=1
MMNSTTPPSEADRLYVALRLKMAETLMADVRASATDDPHFWDRTGNKPLQHRTHLAIIAEDLRVFALAEAETDHIRAFLAEFAA